MVRYIQKLDQDVWSFSYSIHNGYHPLVHFPEIVVAPALVLALDLNWVKAGARAKARARSGFGPALVSREKPPI